MVQLKTFGIGDDLRPLVISPFLRHDAPVSKARNHVNESYIKACLNVMAFTLFRSNESSAQLACTRRAHRKPALIFVVKKGQLRTVGIRPPRSRRAASARTIMNSRGRSDSEGEHGAELRLNRTERRALPRAAASADPDDKPGCQCGPGPGGRGRATGGFRVRQARALGLAEPAPETTLVGHYQVEISRESSVGAVDHDPSPTGGRPVYYSGDYIELQG